MKRGRKSAWLFLLQVKSADSVPMEDHVQAYVNVMVYAFGQADATRCILDGLADMQFEVVAEEEASEFKRLPQAVRRKVRLKGLNYRARKSGRPEFGAFYSWPYDADRANENN